MKCLILHESERRIRFRIPKVRLSLHEADLIEYYLKSLPEIRDAKVYERTCDAVAIFDDSFISDKVNILNSAMANFDASDDKIGALVIDDSRREMNQEYEEKIVSKVMSKTFRSLFFPAPVNAAICTFKSLKYLYSGLSILLSGKIGVPVLDAAAISASILTNDYGTAGNVMFLLEIGEILEEWTRKRSIRDLAQSMSLGVDQVWLNTEEGEIFVPIDSIHVGDQIRVRTSDIIPLDGVVVSGEMTVNQSAMTGESEPVHKAAGSYVYSGTVVEEGQCVIEVRRENGTGKYDQIVRMIEESEKLKSDTETKAYQLADRLVPFNIAGSVITYLLTGNITKAPSFLMVDFSCAMKMSMPLAVLSAIREANTHGISIKSGKFIETVTNADTVISDKTGTLTNATPKLVDVVALNGNDPDEMLKIAACLEEHYPHSVANAIVQGAKDRGISHEEMHGKVDYVIAHGVSSTINDKKTVIGSYHFVIEDSGCTFSEEDRTIINDLPEEYSKIYLGIDKKLVAVLCIFDPIKSDAAEIIRKLRATGIRKICMMTGDNYLSARAVAQQLDLDDFRAEVLPEDKARFVLEEKNAGHKVIMIGDGINDAPALSEADVGIAISEGAAIAREISDITISSSDLSELITLRRLSDALMQRIDTNYRFILKFNFSLIALGVLGILPPSVSALLHNGSTLVTSLNSMTNLLEDRRQY